MSIVVVERPTTQITVTPPSSPTVTVGTGSGDVDHSAIEADIAELQSDVANLGAADVAIIKEAPLNVKAAPFNAQGNDSANDTAAINAALTLSNNVGRGHIYVPPGIYRIDDPLVIKQGTRFECAGSYATVFRATTSDAKVFFNQVTGGGRGPESGGFRMNMAETALVGVQEDLCVNKSFKDIRVDSPAANGIAMLLNDTQNCDHAGIDLEAKGGGEGPNGTRGLVFDRGASGNTFDAPRINEFMGPHVSYRHTAAALGSGVTMPRHNWLYNVMIERTTMSTSSGNTPTIIYHRAGSDNGIHGGNISGTTDGGDPGVTYPIVELDNSGDTGPGAPTATRMSFERLKFNGEIWSGVRRAVVFKVVGNFLYGDVKDNTAGNVRHWMSFTTEGAHCMKDEGNFVDELATSRYLGTSAFMRANFAPTTSGTLDPQRGQIKYFYAGGSADLTNVDPYVETGFEVTVQFYATRTVKHGTGNIRLAGDTDWQATAGDMLYLVHDGAGTYHEKSRVIKS